MPPHVSEQHADRLGDMWSRLRRVLTLISAVCVLVLGAPAPANAAARSSVNVLLFTAVSDPAQAHRSTPEAVELIDMTLRRYGMEVSATDDATAFTTDNLTNFDVVVWLNTYGDVLNDDQQTAFESWMLDGGGFVGIHGAARTEPDWPFYRELVGAHTTTGEDGQITRRNITVDTEHPATVGMNEEWDDHADQWLAFDTDPASLDDVSVLASVSSGQTEQIAITWCRELGPDSGRSWYTALGHNVDAYEDSDFTRMLRGGIWWTAGQDQSLMVDVEDAAGNWPYVASFLVWVLAIVAGGAVSVTILNRREAQALSESG